MSGVPSVHDALVLVGVLVGVYVACVAAAQMLRRSWAVRFGLSFHLFAILLGLLAGIDVSAWRGTAARALMLHLSAAVLLLAAFPVVTILNRVLWNRPRQRAQGSEAPRVLADTTSVLVVLAAALIVLQYIYGVRVPGLLAGSGVVAIIAGLALQNLLGNLFAGIALHFEQPFTTGDWLIVDGVHARVIEVSWRSTRLMTTDAIVIDVANSKIIADTITNVSTPTPRHAVRTRIGLHYDVPPTRALAVLREAAASVPHVCPDQPPTVYLKEFADSSIVYEIKVWIDDHTIYDQVLSDLRSHCWYAARRAGMEIPFPIVTLNQPRADRAPELARAAAGRALRAHPIFSFLSEEDVDRLLDESRIVLFSAAERIIQQGDQGHSMFLIIRGRVEVRMAPDGRSAVAAELGAGGCFGEMSVLTGEPRTATVIALDEVEAVEIPKAAFASLIHGNPEVVGRLTELLAERQAANEQRPATAADVARAQERRAGMLRRVRAFFQLGGV